MRRCSPRCGGRCCRRCKRTGRCASGSSTKPACPRRASIRWGGRGSTAASWARSRAARCWSACRWPPTPPVCRSPPGSTSPKPGRTTPSAGPRPGFPSTSPSRPSRPSRWSRSARRTPPGCRPAWCWPTRSTARPPRSAKGWRRWAWTTRWPCAPPPRAWRRGIGGGPPSGGGRRRARLWRGQEAALTVRALTGRLPRPAWRWVSWREGSGPALTGRFAQARVRVGRDGGEGEQTLLVEWPVGERDPLGYWLVTLAAGTPLVTVVATAKGRWWVEQGDRDLKQEVGLGAYEGRGWRGFHHHVTLTLAAYGFLVLRRCQQPPPAGGRAGVLAFPVVEDPAHPPLRPERHAPASIPTMRRRLSSPGACRVAPAA